MRIMNENFKPWKLLAKTQKLKATILISSKNATADWLWKTLSGTDELSKNNILIKSSS